MVYDDNDEFYYIEENMILSDIDTFISKIKTHMLQELPDNDFRMYIGVNDKKKCFELWFKDSDHNMYKVNPEIIDRDINSLNDKERDNLK